MFEQYDPSQRESQLRYSRWVTRVEGGLTRASSDDWHCTWMSPRHMSAMLVFQVILIILMKVLTECNCFLFLQKIVGTLVSDTVIWRKTFVVKTSGCVKVTKCCITLADNCKKSLFSMKLELSFNLKFETVKMKIADLSWNIVESVVTSCELL